MVHGTWYMVHDSNHRNECDIETIPLNKGRRGSEWILAGREETTKGRMVQMWEIHLQVVNHQDSDPTPVRAGSGLRRSHQTNQAPDIVHSSTAPRNF